MTLTTIGKGSVVVVERAPMTAGQSATEAGFIASVAGRQAHGATKAAALVALDAVVTGELRAVVVDAVNAAEAATEQTEPKQRAKAKRE